MTRRLRVALELALVCVLMMVCCVAMGQGAEPAPGVPDEALKVVLDSLLTWALTGILRWLAPDFWRRLDKRQFRLGVVALVAVLVAIVTGVVTGMGTAAIIKLAVTSLAGAVLVRQSTKMKPDAGPSISRGMSLGTKPPGMPR